MKCNFLTPISLEFPDQHQWGDTHHKPQRFSQRKVILPKIITLFFFTSFSCSFLLFKNFWLHCEAWGILVPWLGIEPRPFTAEAECSNHWPTREFLFSAFKNLPFVQLLSVLDGIMPDSWIIEQSQLDLQIHSVDFKFKQRLMAINNFDNKVYLTSGS